MKKTIIITSLVLSLVSYGTAHSQSNCEYPNRPLINNQCDNSDPCDPTTIKEDTGGSCTPEPVVIPTPVVETPPVEQVFGK